MCKCVCSPLSSLFPPSFSSLTTTLDRKRGRRRGGFFLPLFFWRTHTHRGFPSPDFLGVEIEEISPLLPLSPPPLPPPPFIPFFWLALPVPWWSNILFFEAPVEVVVTGRRRGRGKRGGDIFIFGRPEKKKVSFRRKENIIWRFHNTRNRISPFFLLLTTMEKSKCFFAPEFHLFWTRTCHFLPSISKDEQKKIKVQFRTDSSDCDSPECGN